MPPIVARFHADSGPAALFDRVRAVFAEPRALGTHGHHLAQRAAPDAPLKDLRPFDPAVWDLVLVEARTDTGKFVNSTWRRRYPSGEWWLVIGYGNVVRTLYKADAGKQAKGELIVTGGPAWEFVERVNHRLLTEPPDEA